MQGVDECIGVVQLGLGGVEKYCIVVYGCELLGIDYFDCVVGDCCVYGDDVSFGQQFVKVVVGVVVVRIVCDDLQVQFGQFLVYCVIDGIQVYQFGSQFGDFGIVELLIGDGVVVKDVVGLYICVCGNQVLGDGQ